MNRKAIPRKVTDIDTIILDENGKDTQEQNTSHKGTDIGTLSVEGDGDDAREKKAQRVLTKSNSRTDSHGTTLATNLQDENFSQYDIKNILMQMVTDKMKLVSL